MSYFILKQTIEHFI